MGMLKERLFNFITYLATQVSKIELLLLSLSLLFLLFSLTLFISASGLLKQNGAVVIKHTSIENKTLYVDVGGAVERPGVYPLPLGSRVKDALIAANGVSANADRRYIAQTINAARPIEDGEKIFIPPFATISLVPQDESQYVFGAQTQSAININTASVSQLDVLPCIGEITAKKIIAGRPYQTIINLREKKIVGQALYEKIKSLITTY